MRDSKVVHYMQIPLDIKPRESIKTCFIVYSSRESHINITLDAIETVLESTRKYDIKRLSIHGISGHSQYSQLLDFLNKCSLAIIILDGFRPNVIFEYGILVGLRKPCIVLLEQNATIDIQSYLKGSIKKPPIAPIDMDKDFSDVKDQMYLKYNYNDPKNLREILSNELKKVESQVDEAYMKLVFPEKDYVDKEVKDSIETFSAIFDSEHELTADDEVMFRVCVNVIEKTSKKYDIQLTPYYYYQKIYILTNFKKYEESIKLIDELMMEHSSDTRLLSLKSANLKMQGKHELAIKCLNDAIKIDGKNETLWHHKALLLERLNRKDEAVFCYKKGIEFNDGCSSIHYHYGIILLDDDKYNEALIQFNKALKIRSNESSYLVCKAICLTNLGKKVAAKEAIMEALSFDENNSYAWFQLGQITDNLEEAIKYYNKCLSFNSTHPGALCSRAANLSNIGRYEEALVDLKKAVTYCSKLSRVGCNTIYGNFGRTQYRLYATGKDEYKTYHLEALANYEKALGNKDIDIGDRAEFLNNIGYIYLSLTKISEAKRYLSEAYELKIRDSSIKTVISYNLALSYLLEGDYSNANKLLANIVKLTSKIKPSERKYFCLFIPEVQETNINLVELKTTPDIYECAKVALSGLLIALDEVDEYFHFLKFRAIRCYLYAYSTILGVLKMCFYCAKKGRNRCNRQKYIEQIETQYPLINRTKRETKQQIKG